MHEIGPVQLRMDIHTSDLLQSLPVHTQTSLNLPMHSKAFRSSMAVCISSPRGLTCPPWKLGENLLNCCIKRQVELNKVEGAWKVNWVMSHMQRSWRHETAADNLSSFTINTIRHYKEQGYRPHIAGAHHSFCCKTVSHWNEQTLNVLLKEENIWVSLLTLKGYFRRRKVEGREVHCKGKGLCLAISHLPVSIQFTLVCTHSSLICIPATVISIKNQEVIPGLCTGTVQVTTPELCFV